MCSSDLPQIRQFAGLDHYFGGGEDDVLAVLEALPVRSPSGSETHHDEVAIRSNPDDSAPTGGFDNAEKRLNVRAAENDHASRQTGIRMTLKSSAPGLQVYTGQKLGPIGPGLAIEPMIVPNALAFGEWRSSVVLNAGQLFGRSMTLAFSTFN